MSNSLIPSFLISDVSESLRSLTIIEQCEQIAQVAHQKWATMSDSLRSLTNNEQIRESLVFVQQIAHSLIICSFFCKKKWFPTQLVFSYKENGCQIIQLQGK